MTYDSSRTQERHLLMKLQLLMRTTKACLQQCVKRLQECVNFKGMEAICPM